MLQCFLFFKQKTAYEMRISDWSSDVCSSDLEPDAPAAAGVQVSMIGPALRSSDLDRSIKFYEQGLGMRVLRTIKMGSTTEVILGFGGGIGQPEIGRASGRERVGQYG